MVVMADTTPTPAAITVAVTMAATLKHPFKPMAITAIHRTTAVMDTAKRTNRAINRNTSNSTLLPTDHNPIVNAVDCTLISDASMF